MTRAEDRDEILRLRGERLTYREIARITRVPVYTVQVVCRAHFGDQVARARASLAREVAAGRREAAAGAPLYRYRWPA